MPLDDSLQNLFEIVLRRDRALFAQSDVPVIDATVIEELSSGREDGNFRSDCYLAPLH